MRSARGKAEGEERDGVISTGVGIPSRRPKGDA
jgi:hypothetical protein